MKQTPHKIAFVVGSFAGGGTEHYLLRMLTHIDRERFEPFVVTLSDTGQLREAIHELAPVYVTRLDGKLFNLTGLRELLRLRRWLRTERIDVMHLLMDRATVYGAIAAAHLFDAHRIPAVASHRATMVPDSVGWYLLKLYQISIRHFVDHLIPNSNAVAQVLRDKGVSNKPMTVVYNGIPGDRVRDYTDPPNGGCELTICIVGGLRPEKGHKFAIEAMSQLLATGQPAHLIIVGSGPEEMRLRDLADSLGVTECIEWVGYKEMPISDIERSDVCLLASLSEGFPNVVVEYMACGRPVVATTVGGVAEIVEPGVTGYLVPPGDVPAIVESLITLADDSKLRSAMGQKARDVIESQFTATREAVQTSDIYDAVLEMRPPH
jgi:glycosyltransferase involved in cell wall biosynthesis